MKWFILSLLVALVLIFVWLPEPTAESGLASVAVNEQPSQVESSHSKNFIVRNVRLYDGDQVIEKTDVLVENQLISVIARQINNEKQVPEIDGSGHTLVPGLIDSHTHAREDALAQALNFGVTTELDMFTMPEFSQAKRQLRDSLNNVSEADLFSAGILATAPNGHGTEYGFDIPVISQVSDVEAFVQQRIEQGSDYIKAVYRAKTIDSDRVKAKFQSPSISLEILQALILQAHKQQKMLVVHVEDLLSAKQAIRAGADGIIHSFFDEVADDEFINLMLDKRAFIIPTLLVESSMSGGQFGRELAKNVALMSFAEATQIQQLKAQFIDLGIESKAFVNVQQMTLKLQRAGVPVLAGSDAPNPGTTHGAGLHGELMLLEASGMSAEQVLHSATGQVRKIFPVGHRGILMEGVPASMLLVKGDPTKSIADLQNIVTIWKNGVEYQRRHNTQKVSDTKDTVKPGVVSDFNDSVKTTQFGAGIGATSDKVAGGNSWVNLTSRKKDNSTVDHFVTVSGEIKQGFMFPWGGIAFIPGKSYNLGANLSQAKAFKFSAKGTPNTQEITFMIYQQGSHRPLMQKFAVSTDWQQFVVNFDMLKSIDLTQISNISIAITGTAGPFEFSVDDFILE